MLLYFGICNNAYLHILIEKNVAQLKISVNDIVIVQVFHSHKHLFEVVSVKRIIFGYKKPALKL